jgi:hypothetical protein
VRLLLRHTGGDMTAIASAFTLEGFVIGADGRQLGKGDTIFKESSQKIFNLNLRHVDVAYAWCGETSVVNQSSQVLYDLYEITHAALTTAVLAGPIAFPEFVQECCSAIYDGIIKSPIVGEIQNSDSLPDSRARMLLNGYFHRQPFMTELHVRDKSRISVHAERAFMPLTSPLCNLFNGCTRQNEKYKNVLPGTALEALKLISDYIQECIDSPDPDCFSMGGHRHIAHLTLNGFYWIDAPQGSS